MSSIVKGVGLAATALLVISACAKQDDKRTSRPATSQPAPPRAVELSLGEAQIVKTKPCVGGDDFRLVSASGNTLWLVTGAFQELSYAVRRDGSWSAVQPIAAPGFEFFEHLTAGVDRSGNPVVVWAGYDGTPGEAIAAVRWTGATWSRPEILDRLATCTSVTGLHSLRDSRGILHIAYDRPLRKREEYGWGEGFFPSKCWHAMFDGQRWSTPAPTAGRAPIDMDALGLSVGPDGTLVLAVQAKRMRETGYVGVQVWDGTEWSTLEKLKEAQSGGVVATPWGDRLVWHHSRGVTGCSLVHADRETSVPWSYWGAPVPVASDALGRIAVYLSNGNGGSVRVWSGRSWSQPLPCGRVTQLAAAADGNLLAADWREDGVHIREILVREAPSASPAASQPRELFDEPRSTRAPSLREAILSGDGSRARQMLARNAGLAHERDYHGDTPLLLATKKGDREMVALLLDAHAEVNQGDFLFVTPLHVAAKKGLTEIAELLLAAGARVNEEDSDGRTALAYAQAAGQETMVALLKRHGGTSKDFVAQAVHAAESGEQQTLRALLERGVPVDAAVPNGHCLLDFAAESGNIKVAEMLIARGAAVARADRFGRTALHWAAWEGKAEMCTVLIGYGADPNAKQWEGKTPLHEAVDGPAQPEEALATIKALVAGGAQVNARNNKNVTPLGHAQTYGMDAVREYLRSCGGKE